MTTSTRALLIVAAIVMLPIAMVLGYVYLYIPTQYTAEKLNKRIDAAFADGSGFGKRSTDQSCFVEATRRAKNRTLDALDGQPWLTGCLGTSRQTPGFCDGILAPHPEPDLHAQKAICAERGIGEYCLFFMPTVESYCDN